MSGEWSRFPQWLSGKGSACRCRRHGFDPRVGKSPWRRKWQPPPMFLPGELHGQRSLVRCRPWGQSQTQRSTEHKHTHKQGRGQSIKSLCVGFISAAVTDDHRLWLKTTSLHLLQIGSLTGLKSRCHEGCVPFQRL